MVVLLSTEPLPSARLCVGGDPCQKATGKGRHVEDDFWIFPQNSAGQDGQFQLPLLGTGDDSSGGVGPGHGLRFDIRVAGK